MSQVSSWGSALGAAGEALSWAGSLGGTQALGDSVFMAACADKPALSVLVLPSPAPATGTDILLSCLGSAPGFPSHPAASGLGLSPLSSAPFHAPARSNSAAQLPVPPSEQDPPLGQDREIPELCDLKTN